MMRTAADEARSPKYAHIERERRWLMDRTRLPDLTEAISIEDRYIDGTRLRLRRMRDGNGVESLKLTRKYETNDPLARPIVTAYLNDGEYAVLAALPAATIVKTRSELAANGVDYSIDVFAGALDGLVLAEIEWPDADGLMALSAPPGAIVEINEDPRYQGGTLALSGMPRE